MGGQQGAGVSSEFLVAPRPRYYIVIQSDACPASKPWGVFRETAHHSGKPMGNPHGCHVTQAEAIQQQKAMYVNVPNAGGRSEAPEPPNLRLAADPAQCCGTCKMYFNGECWGYGNYPVEKDQVCDSYEAEADDDDRSAQQAELRWHPESYWRTDGDF